MKILGRGWQYTVYDEDNGRVFKRYHGLFLSYFQIIRYSHNYPGFSIFNIPRASNEMKKKAKVSIQFIKSSSFERALLANPEFLNDVDYKQDKVLSIEEFFRVSSFEQGKKVIDSFVDFTKKIISLGFIDKSFNIGKNFGIAKNGDIVLIDIGELFFEEEKIREQIKHKAWQKEYVMKSIPSLQLQEYFLSQMDKEIVGYF